MSMKREQGTPASAAVAAGGFANPNPNRRRGYSSAQEHPLVQAKDTDFDVEFTSKYIDTLNDLQRLEDENKRLMLRMRSLEAQIVPAGKDSLQAHVKLVAPGCLAYHQEERKLNKALQDENEMLRRQFHNSTNAASEANEKLLESLNKIKLLELELVGKVDEARQGTQTQYTTEIKKLQESLVELERRWGVEKKQLTMERDSYALQCESLKVDATAVKVQLSELTKISNSDTVADLTERLEVLERENTELREQLLAFNRTNYKESTDRSVEFSDTIKLGEQFLPDDPNFPRKLDKSSSREYLLTQSHSTERMELNRPPSSTRAPSPSPLRAPSRPSSTSRTLHSREGDIEGKNREMAQLMARLSDTTSVVTKLENEISAITARNKEYARVAEQNKAIAEQLGVQNEELTAEVKRLSDKIRLLTTLDRFSRPESPPMLPVMLYRSSNSPLSSSHPSASSSALSSSTLSSSALSPSALLSSTLNLNLRSSPTSTRSLQRSLADGTADLEMLKSKPAVKKKPQKEKSVSLPSPPSPSPSPWTTSGSVISGHKITSPKRSFK